MNQTVEWTQEKWNETIASIMRRAATDPDFRAKCLHDARDVVKDVSGLELHPNARLRFTEPQEGLVLALPPLRTGPRELSDAALESVAGGKLCLFGDNDKTVFGFLGTFC